MKNPNNHKRFKDINPNAVGFSFGALIVLLILFYAGCAALTGCRKEVSSLRTQKIETDRDALRPREGYSLTKREYVPQEVNKGKGKGRGKPTPPPTDTTGGGWDTTYNPPPPSGANVLYLDFDGETVPSTYWPAGTVAYSGLTWAEIDSVYARKKREYEPLGYTVTLDRKVYDLAPAGHRHMTIYTESWEWYGQVGGVAYIGSYTFDAPSFVFTSLLSYNPKYIADAGIHEAGHGLGLFHVPQPDGSSAYATYGNYMGASYYVPQGFFESWVRDSRGGYVDQFAQIKSNL